MDESDERAGRGRCEDVRADDGFLSVQNDTVTIVAGAAELV